jgi:hypothetical protein
VSYKRRLIVERPLFGNSLLLDGLRGRYPQLKVFQLFFLILLGGVGLEKHLTMEQPSPA